MNSQSLFELLSNENLALYQQFRRGSGKKLILLHGLGGSGRYWTEPARYLTDDFQVISYDLLGFGESPHPEPFKYYTWQQADALRQAMWNDRIWGKTNVVGHSLGALVALEFAKRYPKKVNRLVLSNIPLIFNSEQVNTMHDRYTIFTETIKNELQRKGLKTVRESKFVHKNIMPRYAKRQMQEQAFTNYDLKNLSQYAYAQSLKNSIENQNSLDNLEKLAMPVYIIRADKDRLVIKSNIDKLAEKIPNCKIIDVAGQHQYPVTHPKTFTGTLTKIFTS